MDGDAVKSDERKRMSPQKKQLLVVLIVSGILIVALIVSIIVVAVNKKPTNEINVPEESAEESSATDDNSGYILNDEELNNAYNEVASKIAEEALIASEGGQGFDRILVMYQDAIDAAEDVRLKAMFETDYYLLWFSMSPTEELKNEVLNALMRIDGVLKTPASAYDVVNIATYYNEQEIVNYYTNLAIERGSTDGGGTEDTGEELETAP